MNEKTQIDIAIAGAGIIGLQLALRLSKLHPDAFIALFEKNTFAGEHQSSRNSGVLHAGIYYDNQSLKHIHCLEGNRLWREIATELDIEILETGKYVISQNQDQSEDLEALIQKAAKNEVPGIRRISQSEKNDLGEFVSAHDGFYSKTSAVLDISCALKRFEEEVFKKDIPLLKGSGIDCLESGSGGIEFQVNGDHFVAQHFINCAGLEAVGLRKQLGLSDYERYWVKGRYVRTSTPLPTKSLIYPIPEKDLKGLGVHLTIAPDGSHRFGPDTLDIKKIDYQLEKDTIDSMYPAISSLFKSIKRESLSVDYAGIRAKIKKGDEVLRDFVFMNEKNHGIKGYHEFLGCDSPGVTASPSLINLVNL